MNNNKKGKIMNTKELYEKLKESFQKLIDEHHLEQEPVKISCRALSVEEAIGETKRKDFPIITGKDIMIQAEYKKGRGQAFTDAPTLFEGTLKDICQLDIENDSHARGVFISSLNAVMNSLGLCKACVHCRKDGPELCAIDIKEYLNQQCPKAKRIGLVGCQPAILQMLSESEREVRVLDLNPANIGSVRYGVKVEDGANARENLIDWADLILCTGSTLCNGTIVDYLDLNKPVVFYGITASGACQLFGWNRVCFADKYEAQ